MAIFGSKTPLHSARRILDTIMASGQTANIDGAVIIEHKTNRNKTIDVGMIYCRSGHIYAVHVESKPIPIGRRVITGNQVKRSDIDRIIQQCRGNDTDPDIVRRLLLDHLITETTLDSYVKEHFLENISEILSWETCTGEWQPHSATKDFTMPNISYEQLKSLVHSRSERYRNFLKELAPYFRADEIDHVAPKSLGKDPSNLHVDVEKQEDIKKLLELSDGTRNIADIADITGMGYQSVTHTFHALWQEDYVHMANVTSAGTISASHADAQFLSESSQKPHVEQDLDIEPIDVIELEEPMESTAENDTHQESAEAESPTEDSTPNRDANSELEPGLDDAVAKVDPEPEVEVQEVAVSGVDPEVSSTPADSSPRNTSDMLESLLSRLSDLRSESQMLGEKIAQVNVNHDNAVLETERLMRESDVAQQESTELEAECNRLREEYEQVASRLNAKYKTLEELSTAYTYAQQKSEEYLTIKNNLESQQEKILDDIESTTRSFSVR